MLSSHSSIIQGCSIAEGKQAMMASRPPDTEGAISSPNHTTGRTPISARRATVRRSSCFIASAPDLFCGRIDGFEQDLIDDIGRAFFLYQIVAHLIERIDDHSILIFIQCDDALFSFRHRHRPRSWDFAAFPCSNARAMRVSIDLAVSRISARSAAISCVCFPIYNLFNPSML